MPKKIERKTKTAKSTSRKKKNNFFFFRGNATIFLIVAVIAIGSIMLVGGITPKLDDSKLNLDESLVIETPVPGTKGDTNLQLKTFKFKKCMGTITVDMLLDRSGSMADENKLGKLKKAVNYFIDKLSDDSIIGFQSFNSISITDDVPISFYKDVKSFIKSRVNSLSAGEFTPTHDALAFSYGKLQEALPKFPGRKFVFIFVSDGLPCPGLCPTAGTSQDPRLYNPNPADQIKALGVTVYSIGIFTRDQASDPRLSGLLKEIATSPDRYYAAPTADELTKIYNAISDRICNSSS